MSWSSFLFAYLLGGLTFLPVVVALSYFALPHRIQADIPPGTTENGIVRPNDELDGLRAAQTAEKDEAKPWGNHAPDVASGYFAVCREYTPMGINAKPIERSTPVGSATVAAPSPSVYQTMYRSIFDRKPAQGPLDNNKSAGQRPRKAGNVFFVVLRHGHLMLFDDDEQLEVRHVVSLAHHNIGLYSGEEPTPEGELFIKRNAICLSRKTDGFELEPDTQVSKPFYLFSENCSAKEDFYFALLRTQEQGVDPNGGPPTPLSFDVKNVISLVQRLHASEDHMQTRWLNALLGRIFLGIYKTKDLENFIREKLTKKISRVKRPSFLSNIAIRAIDTGESAPFITNPRLRDLTVEGECGIEADVRYTGNFRLEVAATARIDLGTRFKAREVNLVLAVVLRKVEGRIMFKVKPPPSNRIWFSFQQMPKMEMTIEPIVSSRQITYTVILRQIENRIKEVVAETLVLPFWDDVPFFRTEHKKWRGGIFDDDTVESSPDIDLTIGQTGDVNEVDQLEGNHIIQEVDISAADRSPTSSVVDKPESAQGTGLFGRRLSNRSRLNPPSPVPAPGSSTGIETKNDTSSVPRPARSTSFANPAAPIVETDATNSDIFKPSSSPPDESPAAAAMATISAKSQSSSPAPTAVPVAFKPYITSKSSNHSSASSREATDNERDQDQMLQATGRRNTASSTGSHDDNGLSNSPSLSSKVSMHSQTGSVTKGAFARRENTTPGSSAPPSPGVNELQKRNALAAVTNAAASARRWGLNALQRHNEAAGARNGAAQGDPSLDLKQPMGRGRPLPPPGVPLPMPDKRTKTAPMPMPKRKPVAPPPLPPRETLMDENHLVERQSVPPPPLPKRRQFVESNFPGDEDMLVVAAPADSEPTTPADPSYLRPWVDTEDMPTTLQPSGETALAQDILASNPAGGFMCIKSVPNVREENTADHAAGFERGLDSGQATVDEVDDDDDAEFSAWMDDPGPESFTQEPAPTSSKV